MICLTGLTGFYSRQGRRCDRVGLEGCSGLRCLLGDAKDFLGGGVDDEGGRAWVVGRGSGLGD